METKKRKEESVISTYYIKLKDSIKCGGCNYWTATLWLDASTAQDALNRLAVSEGHCKECHGDILHPVQGLRDIISGEVIDKIVAEYLTNQ